MTRLSGKTRQMPERKKEQPTGLRSSLEALNRLTDTQPSHGHFALWQEEVTAEKNDRGAAILLGTNVENAIQSAIVRFIDVQAGQSGRLFRSNAPLSSFANKITIAYALNIFGEETQTNLELIRSVRNTFAHAKVPITFETTEVQRACEFLTIPTLLPPHTVLNDRGAEAK